MDVPQVRAICFDSA